MEVHYTLFYQFVFLKVATKHAKSQQLSPA